MIMHLNRNMFYSKKLKKKKISSGKQQSFMKTQTQFIFLPVELTFSADESTEQFKLGLYRSRTN